MDFESIISNTRQYTFHSHTQYCDGRATMETMARAAVACGMRHYGFSPHSPIPVESPCNMSLEDVPGYLDEVKRISSLPELQGCKFYAAMEIDYLGDEWGPASDYFRTLPLDYSIGSVHFIPSQDGEYVDIDGKFENFARRMKEYFHNDIEYVVDTFYAQSRAMIEAGGFDIMGHFDKIGQNAAYYAPGIEDSRLYRDNVESLIGMIIDRRLTIELNTKAREQHGRFFPGERYLPDLIDAGVTVLVNSDAHHPDRIDASRDEAFAILDRIAHVTNA